MDLLTSLPNGTLLPAVACSAAALLLIAGAALRARSRRNRLEQTKRRCRELVQTARRAAYCRSTEEAKRLPGLIKLITSLAEKGGFELWEVGASKTHFARLLAVAGDQAKKASGTPDQPDPRRFAADPSGRGTFRQPAAGIELPDEPDLPELTPGAIVPPYVPDAAELPCETEALPEADDQVLCLVSVTAEQIDNWRRNAVDLPDEPASKIIIELGDGREISAKSLLAGSATDEDDDLKKFDLIFDSIISKS